MTLQLSMLGSACLKFSVTLWAIKQQKAQKARVSTCLPRLIGYRQYSIIIRTLGCVREGRRGHLQQNYCPGTANGIHQTYLCNHEDRIPFSNNTVVRKCMLNPFNIYIYIYIFINTYTIPGKGSKHKYLWSMVTFDTAHTSVHGNYCL